MGVWRRTGVWLGLVEDDRDRRVGTHGLVGGAAVGRRAHAIAAALEEIAEPRRETAAPDEEDRRTRHAASQDTAHVFEGARG